VCAIGVEKGRITHLTEGTLGQQQACFNVLPCFKQGCRSSRGRKYISAWRCGLLNDVEICIYIRHQEVSHNHNNPTSEGDNDRKISQTCVTQGSQKEKVFPSYCVVCRTGRINSLTLEANTDPRAHTRHDHHCDTTRKI
jgi:hypothetical protein